MSLLPNFLDEYRNYLKLLSQYQIAMARTQVITIALRNHGTAPAEDVDVELYFPDGMELYNEEIIPPDEPIPPQKPEWESQYSFLLNNNENIPNLHLFYEDDLDDLPSIPIIRKTNSYQVINHCDLIKHHHRWEWASIWIEFYKPTTNKISFEIPYRITAANMPEKIEDVLRININYEV